MFFAHILTAMAIAVGLWALFSFGFRRGGPWPGLLMFLILIFLGTWAGGVWLQPFGPVFWGVSFLPFLIIGLLVALLVAAATPPPPSALRQREPPPEAEPVVAGIAVSAFFWILIVVLGGSILLRYAMAS